MRTFLRLLAACLVVGSAPVGAAAAFGAAVYAAAGGLSSLATLLLAAAMGFALLAAAGGVLWCLLALPVPPPPADRTPHPVARFWLRVLAQVQIGFGLQLVVAAGAYLFDHLLARPHLALEHTFAALAVFPAALATTTAGGVLWCAVRVAYPAPAAGAQVQTGAAHPGTSAPGR